MITDHQYCAFMKKLLADQRSANRLLDVSDWERNFIFSFGMAQRPSQWFTDGRRVVTDKMWRRLGPDLGLPHPEDTVSESAAVTDRRYIADPAGCEYLVRGDDGRQQRCNEPAVCKEERHGTRAGLRYCELHKAAVERAVKGIVLIKL